MLTLLLILLTTPAPPRAKTVHRVVDRCGIRIEIPRGLRAGASKTADGQCVFDLDPPNWSAIRHRSLFEEPEHVVTVEVSRKPFETVADEAGFVTVAALRRRARGDGPARCEDFSAETWLLPGPDTDCNKASVIVGKSFRGIAGGGSYGRLARDGTRAGLGEYCLAAVTDGTLSVVISDNTGRNVDEVVAWLTTLQRNQRPAN